MKKFIFFFRGGMPPVEKHDENMKAWNAWLTGLFKQGIVDSGLPLTDEGVMVTQEGMRHFHEHEGGRDVTGYLIVNIDSIEEAVALGRSAPHIPLGGSTEIREAMPMDM